MTPMRRRLAPIALFAAIFSGMSASETQAQFTRSGYNPYSSYKPSATPFSSSGFGSSTAPGTKAAGPYGSVITPAMRYSDPLFGNLSIGFQNGVPVWNYSPSSFIAGNGGAGTSSYGAVSSSSNSTRPQVYIPPARAEAPVKAFDRWVIDQQRRGQQDAVQKQQKQQELQRSLTSPSAADVTSGLALNSILESLQSMPERLKATKAAPLAPDFLKQLNFTRGTGSIGLLRQHGKIDWPALVLRLQPAEEIGKLRGQIEKRFQDAFDEVNGGGKADPDNIKALLKLIDQLSEAASGRASTMTFAENLDIKRYLRSLEDSVHFLRQPDASEWLPGKHKAKPKTVQELVQIMGEKGFRFAPALLGSDAAYATMHRLLAEVHTEASR